MIGYKMGVWVGASSLATVVELEVIGDIVEDVCWLRPEGDVRYIDHAKHDAVNLNLQSKVTVLC